MTVSMMREYSRIWRAVTVTGGLELGAKEIARSIWDDTSKDSTHIDFDSSEATWYECNLYVIVFASLCCLIF